LSKDASEKVCITRRAFLAGSAAGLLAAGSTPLVGQVRSVQAKPGSDSNKNGHHEKKSRVVVAEDPVMVPSRVIQESLLRDTLDRSVAAYMGTASAGLAWRKLLGDDDRILIKFNQSAAPLIGTSPAMARTLVKSLLAADFRPEQLCLLEVEPNFSEELKLHRPDHRWQGQPAKFGDVGEDVFRADLDWATAVLNVPFLKTHHMAVMTGCLKNLSHGLIRRPARFHGLRCSPAIAAINAHEILAGKLKLNIINGLRVNFDRGPEASEREIESRGWLAVTEDPVAGDCVGFGYLNHIRAGRGLKPLLASPQLPDSLILADRFGVGESAIERIEQIGLADI